MVLLHYYSDMAQTTQYSTAYQMFILVEIFYRDNNTITLSLCLARTENLIGRRGLHRADSKVDQK